MKAKTIEQFKILRWIEYNFIPGSVKISFTGRSEAMIEDQEGGKAVLKVSDSGEVYLSEGEEA